MELSKQEEVLRMWDGGMSVKNIAVELEVTEPTVRTVLKQHTRPTKRDYRRPDEAEIVKAYQDGEQVALILSRHNLSYPMLYTILNRNDIPLRKKTEEPGRKHMLETAVQMYQNGAMLWDIQRETGVAQPTLHNELHRLDIPLRRPRKHVA
jgi:transposase-like protein